MLSIAAGLLLALSVRPLATPVLTLVALAPLFVATHRVTPGVAIGLGWLAASIATFIGFAFVPPALARSGALAAPLAWAALGAFALFRGGWLGLAMGAAAVVPSRRRLLVAALSVVLFERVLPTPIP
ncbi:MAG: hypothetical protein JNK04_24185, partial [Myxococcales bacterium]|nr:hypothetical protein [Myxococcales bacterium]